MKRVDKLPVDATRHISTERLREYCDPFATDLWCRGTMITREEVRLALEAKQLTSKPYDAGYKGHHHVERIAYFVENGWSDSIALDVGVPSLGCYVDWLIVDGNHRFAAALYRGDKTILVSISGQISYIEQLFPEISKKCGQNEKTC